MRTSSQCSCGVLVGHEMHAPAFQCPGCKTFYWTKGLMYNEAVVCVNRFMRNKPVAPNWVTQPTREFIAATFHCEQEPYSWI